MALVDPRLTFLGLPPAPTAPELREAIQDLAVGRTPAQVASLLRIQVKTVRAELKRHPPAQMIWGSAPRHLSLSLWWVEKPWRRMACSPPLKVKVLHERTCALLPGGVSVWRPDGGALPSCCTTVPLAVQTRCPPLDRAGVKERDVWMSPCMLPEETPVLHRASWLRVCLIRLVQGDLRSQQRVDLALVREVLARPVLDPQDWVELATHFCTPERFRVAILRVIGLAELVGDSVPPSFMLQHLDTLGMLLRAFVHVLVRGELVAPPPREPGLERLVTWSAEVARCTGQSPLPILACSNE